MLSRARGALVSPGTAVRSCFLSICRIVSGGRLKKRILDTFAREQRGAFSAQGVCGYLGTRRLFASSCPPGHAGRRAAGTLAYGVCSRRLMLHSFSKVNTKLPVALTIHINRPPTFPDLRAPCTVMMAQLHH